MLATIHALIILIISLLTFFVTNIAGSKITDYSSLTLLTEDDTESSFNFIFKILAPNILLLIFAALMKACAPESDLYSLIWLIVPTQIIIRITFNIGKLKTINWNKFIIRSTVSIIISYFIHRKIISDNSLLFPDIRDILNQIWLLIFVYLYIVANNILNSKSTTSDKRIKKYIIDQYTIFRKKYKSTVDKEIKDEDLKIFFYAIMISENFNRPLGVRFMERISHPLRKRGTYGIMQISSAKPLSDLKSVEIGASKIKSSFEQIFANGLSHANANGWPDEEKTRKTSYERVAWFYNRNDDYASEVVKVYEDIKDWKTKTPKTQVEIDAIRMNPFEYYIE